jgi:hypothetical protein
MTSIKTLIFFSLFCYTFHTLWTLDACAMSEIWWYCVTGGQFVWCYIRYLVWQHGLHHTTREKEVICPCPGFIIVCKLKVLFNCTYMYVHVYIIYTMHIHIRWSFLIKITDINLILAWPLLRVCQREDNWKNTAFVVIFYVYIFYFILAFVLVNVSKQLQKLMTVLKNHENLFIHYYSNIVKEHLLFCQVENTLK